MKKNFHIAVIQGSLSPTSRTAIVIGEVVKELKQRKVSHKLIDLREIDMEWADGRDIKEYDKKTQAVHKELEKADAYIIGQPVYQYSITGPLKNFLDIHSGAMEEKYFSVVLNSGGIRSYLASAELIKLMSFEMWAMAVQPTVHTWKKDFEDGKLVNDKVFEKIRDMIDHLLKHAK